MKFLAPFSLLALSLFLILTTACGNKSVGVRKTFKIDRLKAGQAVIEDESGLFSAAMPLSMAFSILKSNQKLHIATGRAELTAPLTLDKLTNIEIIGKNSSLVAKIDMPVLTMNNISKVRVYDVLIVHEIGQNCSQNCLEFYNSDNITIENCKFDGSGYFGLALTKTKNTSVTGSKFYNCEYGLAAWDSENITVKKNNFSKNRNLNIMVNQKEQFANDILKDNTYE
jgi:parallel beta-helix repeat protein